MPEPRSCPTSACLQPPRGIITKASNSEAGESHRIPTLASCDTSLVNRPFSFFISKARCRTSHVSDCAGCAIQQPLCEAACPPPIWASSSELPTAKVNCAASPGLPSGSPWQDSAPPSTSSSTSQSQGLRVLTVLCTWDSRPHSPLWQRRTALVGSADKSQPCVPSWSWELTSPLPSLPVPIPIAWQSRRVQTHAASDSTSRWLLIKKISREQLLFICSTPCSQNRCRLPVLINRGHVHAGNAPFYERLIRGDQHCSQAPQGPREAILQRDCLLMASCSPRPDRRPTKEAALESARGEMARTGPLGSAPGGQDAWQSLPRCPDLP